MSKDAIILGAGAAGLAAALDLATDRAAREIIYRRDTKQPPAATQ